MKCIVSILKIFKKQYLKLVNMYLIEIKYNLLNILEDVQHYRVEELLVSKIKLFIKY